MRRTAAADSRSGNTKPVHAAGKRFNWSSPRAIAWICAFALAVLGAANDRVVAQTSDTYAQFELNILAQPLAAAISSYATATGYDVLYDADLAVGRLSSEVRGTFLPLEALKKLLMGTGLRAELVTGKTFVLQLVPAGQQVRSSSSLEQQHYYGLIQAAVTDALCETQGARPGDYRFTAKLWVAKDGAIVKSRRIGSTGTSRRDDEIDKALRRIQLGAAPPPGFRQPVIMLIVPQGAGVTHGCDRP